MKRILIVTVCIALAACTGGAAHEGLKIASGVGAATNIILSPSQLAQLQTECSANQAITDLASVPGLPATVTQSAVYPAAFCAQLATGVVPATTNANTTSWLSQALAVAQAAAQIAGIILPLVL